MKIEFKYDNQDELEKYKEKLRDLTYLVINNTIIINDDSVIENCLDFINAISKLDLEKSNLIDKEIAPLIKKLLILHNRVVLNEEVED